MGWVLLVMTACSLATTGVSEACGGGGVVSSRPGSVGADAQRVLLSVHRRDPGAGGGQSTTTDVIAQIAVPDTTDDYGVLLPMPTSPTIDPEPVALADLELLDAATAPQIVKRESDGSGSGCGCLGATGGAVRSKGEDGTGARVSEPVNIGPVTAVVLTGTTDAVNVWLGENGFAISAADQATVAAYSGYYFVAIRRNETAAAGGPTSIGIHFNMPGDHREVPLRFASLGAAPSVAFTVFLATTDLAGPSAPFAALTLDDLDAVLLRAGSYPEAVRKAVSAHGNRAFVLESRTATELLGMQGARIASLIDGNTTITRLSTIVPAAALTEDAHFQTPYRDAVPNERYVSNSRGFGSREASMGALALALAGAFRRRRRG
ncbi:MAG TPA: DUF2330 domain-containing protein [Polyangiaceae bacterium]|nr:DUF2330 domain-containing protein [Polyangiaceae bacterium]